MVCGGESEEAFQRRAVRSKLKGEEENCLLPAFGLSALHSSCNAQLRVPYTHSPLQVMSPVLVTDR